MSSTDRIARALSALDQVLVQPVSGRSAAEELLKERADDEAAAIALRAIGLSWRENGNLLRSMRSLRRAIRVAEKASAAYRAAEARMSLVVILSDRGNTDAALAEAALAATVLTGTDLARLGVNEGLVLMRIGRTAEALTAFERSQPILRMAGDTRWEALLLNIRAVLHTQNGRYRDAASDLARGNLLTTQGGYRMLNAVIRQNLGYVARQYGDVPAALGHLDTATALYAEHGKRGSSLFTDKADILLMVGLTGESRAALAEAIAEQEASGYRYNLAESHLYLARTALADGDPAASAEAARTARAMFARQRRTAWADLARHAAVAARFAEGERTASLLKEAVEVSDRLRTAAWPVSPYEARLLAGRIAADLGRADQARTLFADIARHRTRGVAELRAIAWHARALHALADGRPAAAERALQAGLRVHAENNAVLGATDLRAHAAVHGRELATLGLRLALERGDARAVLRWAETWRAASLRRRPVRPPDDEQLADDLTALRRVVAEIAEGTSGTVGRSETNRLNAERFRLEQAVRDRSRYARGTYAPEPPFSPAALATALGDRTLVEFIRLGDDMHAVTIAGGVVRRHRLGSYADVLSALDKVRFSMNRMSRRFGSPAVQAAAVQAYDHSRKALDDLLFTPLRRVITAADAASPTSQTARASDAAPAPATAIRFPVQIDRSVAEGRATVLTDLARGDCEPDFAFDAADLPGLDVATDDLHAVPLSGGPAVDLLPVPVPVTDARRRELVIVPTGSLHALPWTVLPTCADRPVSVTPSARLWLATVEASAEFAAGAPAEPSDGRTVLVAGPGLAHAEPEIAALAARYPDARVLTGPAADAETIADALDGASLAHIATHGRFRADHPLFSSLDAADGPLYVYDLERLAQAPGLLILSACESALSGVRPGDEIMGLASAVFALGTRTLIASVTPVNDSDTRTLMLALHAALAAGLPPAAALAEASTATGIGGFVCFGFGG